jgi:uncharacterized protein (DUF2249 family)
VIGFTISWKNIFYNVIAVNEITGVILLQTFAKVINVPDYPPREKHPTIFKAFDALASGEIMQIINDHDPKPLLYQFMMERAEQFTWEYTEEGPEIWKVTISKR